MIAASARPARARRVIIPFVTTPPLTDLRLVILLLPLWWVLGAEQFVAPLLLGVSILKLLVLRRRIVFSRPLVWLLLFIAVSVLAALFIVEPYRIVTFVRNTSMYLMAAFVLVIVTTTARSWKQLEPLLESVVYAMAFSALIGLLGIVGLTRPTFISPVGAVLPEWVVSRGYGEAIALRQTGNLAWFSGLGNYFRVNGFFLFSTMYAAALALSIPIALFLASRARSLHRLALVAILGLLSLNLIFTTGRMAILALALAGSYYLLRHQRRLIRVITLTCTVGLTILIALVLPLEQAYERIEDALYARGQGSVVSRTFIYQKTLEGLAERPVFGWGTERDIDEDNFLYPAGSHSTYLGTLYKQGSVGFLVLLALGWTLWQATSLRGLPTRGGQERQTLRAFLATSRWVLLTAILIGFTSVLDLDATLMLHLWVVLACAVAARRLLTLPSLSSSGGAS